MIENGETQHVDLKGPMAFEGDHRLELAKDIIAMGNTRDGGTLVIGVRQDREKGNLQFDGLTPAQAATFDVTKIHDFVKQRAAPPVKSPRSRSSMTGSCIRSSKSPSSKTSLTSARSKLKRAMVRPSFVSGTSYGGRQAPNASASRTK
jgi:hypothetical protein